jgi:hypothetical protein
MKRSILLAFALAAAASAAIDGTVQNLTSGKPQPNAIVTLMELGSGMNNVGSVKTDASGKFTFSAEVKPGTPYLIQALHHGVTYNQMLQPGAPATGIGLNVYDASDKAPDAKVSQHMILLEPSGTELVVNESVIFNNTGKSTYQDPDGTLKVFVPSAVNTPVRLRITAPQGMPISRDAEKGKAANTYVVRYPIKPGETRIDLQYAMPAGNPAKYESKIFHGGGPVRIVAPRGVTLEGPALTNLGPEPRTQATVYEVKGTEYALNISGTGALRDASAGSGEGREAPAASDTDTPGIDMIKARIYQRVELIVGLTLAMLAIGFVMLYRTA